MGIRDRELYKIKNGGEYGTFEAYCKGVWDFTKSYANYLVSATSVIDNLSETTTMVVKPESERQARPLAKLEPSQQREAWQKAVEPAPKRGLPRSSPQSWLESRRGIFPKWRTERGLSARKWQNAWGKL